MLIQPWQSKCYFLRGLPLGNRKKARRMHNSDYYREQAAKYRELGEGAKDAATKQEFLELAAACDEVADKIDDCRASG